MLQTNGFELHHMPPTFRRWADGDRPDPPKFPSKKVKSDKRLPGSPPSQTSGGKKWGTMAILAFSHRSLRGFPDKVI